MIEKILLLIFALRPLIDLYWSSDFFGQINFAGIIAIFNIGISVFYTIINGKIKKLPIVILLAIYTLSITILSFGNFSDYDNLLRLLSSMPFILIVAPNVNEKDIEKYISLYIVCTIIPIIITFLQVGGIVDYTYWDYIFGVKIPRGSGGYRQPSVLTRFLIFGIIYSLYFLSRYKDKNTNRKRLFIYLYLSINSIAIFLSYHRTGYLLAVAVFVLWYTIEYKNRLIQLIKRLIIYLILGTALFWTLYLNGIFSLSIAGFKSLLSFENVYKFSDGKFSLVLRGRGSLLDKLLYGFQINPWYHTIFGNGKNTNAISGLSFEIADMDLIRILWNFGVIGFILWTLQIIWFRKILIDSKSYIDPYIHRIGYLIVFVYIVFGFTIEATVTPNFMYHVYLILGYIYFQKYLKYLKGNKLNKLMNGEYTQENGD